MDGEEMMGKRAKYSKVTKMLFFYPCTYTYILTNTKTDPSKKFSCEYSAEKNIAKYFICKLQIQTYGIYVLYAHTRMCFRPKLAKIGTTGNTE